MHALFGRAPGSRAEAVEACRRYLAAGRPWWRVVHPFLPLEVRDEVVALAAWHAVTRELLAAPRAPAAAERAHGECRAALDGIAAGRPAGALAAALAPVLARHRIDEELLRGRLAALERDAHVHVYGTRDEIFALARRIAHPEGRLYLRVAGVTGERRVVLADALCTGLQLTAWIANLRPLLDRGHLYLPMEELARHGVGLARLRDGRMDDAARRLVAAAIGEARAHLAKGWPLCAELGPRRGRLLAFVLRWHAAALSAIEARGGDALAGPPPAGWLRLAACGTASLAGRGAPW
ncbi:MAG: squalene/phytoene synthase family protein [Planctomycetota bacterium]